MSEMRLSFRSIRQMLRVLDHAEMHPPNAAHSSDVTLAHHMVLRTAFIS